MARRRLVEVTARVNTDIDVEVDAMDVIDQVLDQVEPDDLRHYGLTRAICRDSTLELAWRRVAAAMRRGDTREVQNTLTALAWDQAGVVLPAL